MIRNILILLILIGGLVYAGAYQCDEDMNFLENDIYNATHINGTNIYQDGSKVLDVDDNATTYSYVDSQDVKYNNSIAGYIDGTFVVITDDGTNYDFSFDGTTLLSIEKATGDILVTGDIRTHEVL